jgi:Archaeal Type IV pilin, N-terminal
MTTNKYARPAFLTLRMLLQRSLRSGHAARAWRRRRHRGVSDVVATILILALTVTLFSALFAFVSRFPAPPAQSVNQFQATATSTTTNASGNYCGTTKLTSSSTGICSIAILQDGGPPVPSSDRVYLESSRTTTNWQFAQATGIPVAWGINNFSGGWETGAYWTESFATPIKNPANVTVYIVSSSQLLYSGVVPGAGANNPPVLTSAYTSPSSINVGEAFQVFAFVSGATANLSLNISLSDVPGLPSTVQAMHPYGTGEWVYNASGPTANGSYLGFIQGANTSGGTIAGSVSVFVAGSGGGGSTSAYTVSVGISPETPPVPQNATLTPTFFVSATVNYTGTLSSVPVWVNFTITQTPHGAGTAKVFTTTLVGQTGLTVSGPGTVVVYSQKGFGGWLLNSTVKVTATVNMIGVAKTTASTTIATLNLVDGFGAATSSQVASTTAVSSSNEVSTWSHSCGTTTCPYLYMTIWDNFTAPLGGPSHLYFNASVYETGSGGTCSATCNATISVANSTYTKVTPGSLVTVNAVSPGGTTRLSNPGWWAHNVVVKVTVWAWIYWGTTVVGYAYGTWTGTALS